MKKQKLVVLTGAGISAESGIKTFRASDGLWENHRIEDVATPDGYRKNPELVLEFYNQRRRQLFEVEPNDGHRALVALEKDFEVHVITQNVDDLHERAGSANVVHLHGELRKARSVQTENLISNWDGDIKLGDKAPDGGQWRPHIVWFGEAVPMLELAADIAAEADIFMVVGTSLQVYPAAGLMGVCDRTIPVFYIDPRPQVNHELRRMPNLTVIEEPASTGIERARRALLYAR